MWDVPVTRVRVDSRYGYNRALNFTESIASRCQNDLQINWRVIVQVEVTSAYFSYVEPECHYHVKCYNFLQCYMQVHLLLTITRQPDCPDGLGTLLQLSLCRLICPWALRLQVMDTFSGEWSKFADSYQRVAGSSRVGEMAELLEHLLQCTRWSRCLGQTLSRDSCTLRPRSFSIPSRKLIHWPLQRVF